jgi:hypothetical protein
MVITQYVRLDTSTREGNVEDSALFSIRIYGLLGKDEIHNWIVLDLTGESVPSSHHINDHNVVRLTALCTMHRRKLDLQSVRGLSSLVELLLKEAIPAKHEDAGVLIFIGDTA